MAEASQTRRICLDGGLVDLTGPGDFSTPWASFADIMVAGALREIGSGPMQWGFDVAQGADVELSEQYTYRDGNLHFGSAARYEERTDLHSQYHLAVWIGDGLAVKVHGFETVTDVVAFFENFDFIAGAIGMELRIKRGSSFSLVRGASKAPVYLQNVAGMGMFEVRQLTPAKRKHLPNWAGASARGGMLYVEGKDTPDWSLLLVGNTAVTRLYPNHWEAPPEDIAQRFSETTVRWE